MEKLNELMDKGEEIARQRIAEEEERVNQLYRGFENISINRTKADKTERNGIRRAENG
jgi:hypothetical protein